MEINTNQGELILTEVKSYLYDFPALEHAAKFIYDPIHEDSLTIWVDCLTTVPRAEVAFERVVGLSSLRALNDPY